MDFVYGESIGVCFTSTQEIRILFGQKNHVRRGDQASASNHNELVNLIGVIPNAHLSILG